MAGWKLYTRALHYTHRVRAARQGGRKSDVNHAKSGLIQMEFNFLESTR